MITRKSYVTPNISNHTNISPQSPGRRENPSLRIIHPRLPLIYLNWLSSLGGIGKFLIRVTKYFLTKKYSIGITHKFYHNHRQKEICLRGIHSKSGKSGSDGYFGQQKLAEKVRKSRQNKKNKSA